MSSPGLRCSKPGGLQEGVFGHSSEERMATKDAYLRALLMVYGNDVVNSTMADQGWVLGFLEYLFAERTPLACSIVNTG